jgi:plasmid stabilization system protein ParE
MALKVRLHRRARADLRSIHDFLIQSASARAADRVRAHLWQRITQLSRLPHMGVVTSERRIRILAPTRYPYRIYYTVQRNEVAILHIRHTARQAPEDLGL